MVAFKPKSLPNVFEFKITRNPKHIKIYDDDYRKVVWYIIPNNPL